MSPFGAKSTRAFAGSPQAAPFGTDRCLSCAVSIHRIDELDRRLIVVPFMGPATTIRTFKDERRHMTFSVNRAASQLVVNPADKLILRIYCDACRAVIQFIQRSLIVLSSSC